MLHSKVNLGNPSSASKSIQARESTPPSKPWVDKKHRYQWLHNKITANDKKKSSGWRWLGYLMLQSNLCPDIFAKSLTENLRIWFSIRSEEESMPRKVAFL